MLRRPKSERKLIFRYNAIYIKPYQGEPADEELRYLLPYLLALESEVNFRAIEKRHWRQRAPG